MNNLPQHLADAVKKEAERQADEKNPHVLSTDPHEYGALIEGFEAGAAFLHSIQPESESEKVIKEKDDYIRYLQARIDQMVKNREIVHSENERLTVGYWEQVQACEELRAIQPDCRWTDEKVIEAIRIAYGQAKQSKLSIGETIQMIMKPTPPQESEHTAGSQANMVQTVCEKHEYALVQYSDNFKTHSYYACKFCGAMQPEATESREEPASPLPQPEGPRVNPDSTHWTND